MFLEQFAHWGVPTAVGNRSQTARTQRLRQRILPTVTQLGVSKSQSDTDLVFFMESLVMWDKVELSSYCCRLVSPNYTGILIYDIGN